MKDSLQIFHEFSAAVVAAMNSVKVFPPKSSENVCGVIIIVAPENGSAPISASLNYDWKNQVWELLAAELAEPIN